MDRFLSRKFLVTLASLVTIGVGGGSTLQMAIAAVVAVVYVVAQAFVDRASVDRVARAVEQGIRHGRELSDDPLLEEGMFGGPGL